VGAHARSGRADAIPAGISYRCGTFALYRAAAALKLSYDPRPLIGTPSPTNGFSMQALADLSGRLGLGFVAVQRQSGAFIPVPSVVHWSQNHYAAIAGREGDLFKIVDPTFAGPRYMSADTINAEASGAFMVQAGQVPPGFSNAIRI